MEHSKDLLTLSTPSSPSSSYFPSPTFLLFLFLLLFLLFLFLILLFPPFFSSSFSPSLSFNSSFSFSSSSSSRPAPYSSIYISEQRPFPQRKNQFSKCVLKIIFKIREYFKFPLSSLPASPPPSIPPTPLPPTPSPSHPLYFPLPTIKLFQSIKYELHQFDIVTEGRRT